MLPDRPGKRQRERIHTCRVVMRTRGQVVSVSSVVWSSLVNGEGRIVFGEYGGCSWCTGLGEFCDCEATSKGKQFKIKHLVVDIG